MQKYQAKHVFLSDAADVVELTFVKLTLQFGNQLGNLNVVLPL